MHKYVHKEISDLLTGFSPTSARLAGDSVLHLTDASGATHSISVWGDCCSYSIIDEIVGIQTLLNGEPILSVEELYDNTKDRLTISQFDIAQPFSLLIRKPSGDVAIFAWNVSNGYYYGEFRVWDNFYPLNSIVKDISEIDHYNGLNAWDWRNNM